ncbi:hypothetical protein [Actinomyces bouchesdurhonensis]|uniref:hypothetical protein n=1 Tax=Actinomyces bouchesdurhonensis TaxID=1852361 RepID=UPI0028F1304A|nr:hypothetical protein [Actinomyces bouchesdurhonensis]
MGKLRWKLTMMTTAAMTSRTSTPTRRGASVRLAGFAAGALLGVRSFTGRSFAANGVMPLAA